MGVLVARNSGSKVGYARVSTTGQSLDTQLNALREAGCDRIYNEKESGATTDNREQLAEAIAFLREGDTLVVTKLDRMARSARDLLNILHNLEAKGATFKALGDGWCDTTTPQGKLLVTVMAGFAEFERSLILMRTAEGRAAAMARDVKFGRKHKLTQYQRLEILQRLRTNESWRSIARSYGVHHNRISAIAEAAGISPMDGPAISISGPLIRPFEGAATPVPDTISATGGHGIGD